MVTENPTGSKMLSPQQASQIETGNSMESTRSPLNSRAPASHMSSISENNAANTAHQTPTPSINLAVSTEPTSHNTASANTPPSRPPTNHMSVAGVRNQNPTQIGYPSGPSSSLTTDANQPQEYPSTPENSRNVTTDSHTATAVPSEDVRQRGDGGEHSIDDILGTMPEVQSSINELDHMMAQWDDPGRYLTFAAPNQITAPDKAGELMENIDAGGMSNSLAESSGSQSMYNILPSKSDNLAYATAPDRSLPQQRPVPKPRPRKNAPSSLAASQEPVNVSPNAQPQSVTGSVPVVSATTDNQIVDSGGARPKTTPVLPAASTPALHPERTTRAVAKPMRMNEEYYRPGMNSLSSPNSAPVLRLRPENNRPGRDYSQPLNLTENVTAQDRALSEQEAMAKFKVHVQKAKLKEGKGFTNQAIEQFKEALKYEQLAKGGVHEDVARTCGLIGRMCSKQGRDREAVDYLGKELEIYRNLRLSEEYFADKYWMTYDALAQAYSGLHMRDKEIENYTQAIEIIMKYVTVPPARLPHMHNNIGNAYRSDKDLNKAREHIEQAKEMMMFMHGAEPVEEMAKVHSSLGDVYRDLQLIPQAIAELERCLQIREMCQQGPEGGVLRGPTHDALASLYDQQGNENMAKYHRETKQAGVENLLMADPEQKQQMVKNLQDMVRGSEQQGMLGKLAAGLTANEDIQRAQQYQAEDDSLKAIECYQKAIDYVNSLPQDVGVPEEFYNTLALCHNNMGNAYRKIARVAEAESHLRQALEIREKLYGDEVNDETASTLFNLGHLLQGIGGRVNTTNAIKYHEECLKMYHQLSPEANQKWIISLHRSLGEAYEANGNSRKSIENYQMAKDILVRIGDMDGLRAVCNNMGNSYETIGDFDRAEENIEQALNMAIVLASESPEDISIQNHIAAGYNNLGILYQGQGRYKLSLDNLLKSLEIREKYKEESYEAAQDAPSSYHNIGNTYAKMDKFPEAIDYYKRELECRRMMGEDTTNVRVTLSHVYQTMGDNSNAELILEEN